MMLKIWASAEHASWTTKRMSFPKNISILNFLVKYFPGYLTFSFKEALLCVMHFVVFFLLTVKLHNLLGIFQIP